MRQKRLSGYLDFNPFNNFGVPRSAGSSIYRERQIQLGLRFLF